MISQVNSSHVLLGIMENEYHDAFNISKGGYCTKSCYAKLIQVTKDQSVSIYIGRKEDWQQRLNRKIFKSFLIGGNLGLTETIKYH